MQHHLRHRGHEYLRWCPRSRSARIDGGEAWRDSAGRRHRRLSQAGGVRDRRNVGNGWSTRRTRRAAHRIDRCPVTISPAVYLERRRRRREGRMSMSSIDGSPDSASALCGSACRPRVSYATAVPKEAAPARRPPAQPHRRRVVRLTDRARTAPNWIAAYSARDGRVTCPADDARHRLTPRAGTAAGSLSQVATPITPRTIGSEQSPPRDRGVVAIGGRRTCPWCHGTAVARIREAGEQSAPLARSAGDLAHEQTDLHGGAIAPARGFRLRRAPPA